MKEHRQYLKYVIRHKWYVFLECMKLGVPLWIAFWHDWDKFLPDEWGAYVHTLYAWDGAPQFKFSDEFAKAWLLHRNRNKHHWQYWILHWDMGKPECLQMPNVYVREMVADWRGTGKALGKPDTRKWYEENKSNIQLHSLSRFHVEELLRNSG